MKAFQGRISLTKNWPGGRKNATVIETQGKTNSVPNWNHQVVNTIPTWNEGIRSYLAPVPPPSEGGMADPTAGLTALDIDAAAPVKE